MPKKKIELPERISVEVRCSTAEKKKFESIKHLHNMSAVYRRVAIAMTTSASRKALFKAINYEDNN